MTAEHRNGTDSVRPARLVAEDENAETGAFHRDCVKLCVTNL
jgi:hypothetical protein